MCEIVCLNSIGEVVSVK